MSTIRWNLQAVHERIDAAAHAVARNPQEVTLVAVSKGFDADAVIAAADAGQRVFGESYLQEALPKIAAVREARPDLLMEWHFIGPIQSNKTRQIAEHFDWVHSVDREKIAQRLFEQRPSHLAPLNICLQINISEEASKSGIAPQQTLELAQRVAIMPQLRLRGLMAIPEPSDLFEQQRAAFHRVRKLFDHLNAQEMKLDTLSMGMSADLAAAIAEGATMIRIGTAIFGQRDYAK